MENPTQTFREVMNLVLHLIEELQTKIKTVMSVGACKRKKSVFFVTFILSEGIFFIICFFSIYSMLNKLYDLLHHCSHSTTWHQEYDIVPSLSWLEKHTVFDNRCFKSF